MKSANITYGRALPTWIRRRPSARRRRCRPCPGSRGSSVAQRSPCSVSWIRIGHLVSLVAAFERRDRERRDALAAPDEAHALVRRAPSRSRGRPRPPGRPRAAPPSRLHEARAAARSAITVTSTFADPPALRASARDHLAPAARCCRRPRSAGRVREVLADVAEPGRTEHGVDHRVCDARRHPSGRASPGSPGSSTPPSTSCPPALEAVRVVADAERAGRSSEGLLAAASGCSNTHTSLDAHGRAAASTARS